MLFRSSPGAEPFRHLNIPKGVTPATHRRKLELLRRLNEQHRATREHQSELEARIRSYELAYRMQSAAPEAVDLSRESEATKRLYGFGNKDTEPFGRCCLLARRMVEAGCRFVSIENGHWDTHRKNTWSLRELLCPSFDQAVPALLNDLDQRGLLDSTLVVVTTEFGRTPRINALAGRDHWPNAFSVVMAGAGIKGGQVVGATDKHGASVADRPISPEDLTATILHKLGIDPATVLKTPIGRPVQLADGGKVISELT